MASTALRPVAFILTCATGAAVAKLYMGNQENEENRNVENEVDELRDLGRKMQNSLKNATTSIQAVSASVSAQVSQLESKIMEKTPTERKVEKNEELVPPKKEEIQTVKKFSERAFCHTCSGPRIWFFAEKLRLKRRLTPYPDPPRNGE